MAIAGRPTLSMVEARYLERWVVDYVLDEIGNQEIQD